MSANTCEPHRARCKGEHLIAVRTKTLAKILNGHASNELTIFLSSQLSGFFFCVLFLCVGLGKERVCA